MASPYNYYSVSCQDGGSQWKNPVHVPVKHKSEKSILPDLEGLPLDPKIKQKAQEINIRLNRGTHRGKKRKKLLFYCIDCAYLEFGLNRDPGSIAEMVGIERGDTIKAYSMFSEIQTGFRPKTKTSDPIGLLPEYCKNIRLSSEFVIPLQDLGRRILEKDPELLEQYPQTVAVGILKYFLVIHGIEINIDHFSKKLRLSQATINAMYKRIAELDNKD